MMIRIYIYDLINQFLSIFNYNYMYSNLFTYSNKIFRRLINTDTPKNRRILLLSLILRCLGKYIKKLFSKLIYL